MHFFLFFATFKFAAAQQAAKEGAEVTVQPLMPEEVTFDPIDYRPLRARRTYPLQHAIRVNTCDEVYPPPLFLTQKEKIPINRYCTAQKKAVILQRKIESKKKRDE